MAPDLPPEERTRRAEAARWLARLQAGDCTAGERAACRRWQDADPANAAAYAQMQSIYLHSAEFRLDPERRAVADALRAGSARRAQRRQAAGRWGMGLSAAAVLALAVGIGWRTWDPAQPEQGYASAVGEQRTLALDDGSSLLLDTDSAVQVRYSRRQRQLVLERGQAQFTVAAAPGRPFVVRAGGAAVRAVGTQFQVRRHADSVQVNLLEGVVEVTAPDTQGGGERIATLAPGEQLTLDARGRWDKHALDLEIAEGWTRGELVFRQTPLSQLVDEMNRYTPVKLRLGDPGLDDIRLSGVFYGSDQDTLVEALEQIWSLRAERRQDEIIIHRR